MAYPPNLMDDHNFSYNNGHFAILPTIFRHTHLGISKLLKPWQDDEELLYDKVSGFFTVLHESMEGQDGPRYCPRHSMKHIKDWLRRVSSAVCWLTKCCY